LTLTAPAVFEGAKCKFMYIEDDSRERETERVSIKGWDQI
jgi:hypothetical protein